jgi:hypothetical protein
MNESMQLYELVELGERQKRGIHEEGIASVGCGGESAVVDELAGAELFCYTIEFINRLDCPLIKESCTALVISRNQHDKKVSSSPFHPFTRFASSPSPSRLFPLPTLTSDRPSARPDPQASHSHARPPTYNTPFPILTLRPSPHVRPTPLSPPIPPPTDHLPP